jgi:hypothetical protein
MRALSLSKRPLPIAAKVDWLPAKADRMGRRQRVVVEYAF